MQTVAAGQTTQADIGDHKPLAGDGVIVLPAGDLILPVGDFGGHDVYAGLTLR